MIGLGFCLPALAQDAPNATQELQGLLEQTQTLTAQVNQLQIDQDGRELQEYSAILVMQKPANFRWAITEPYEELMVTDGTTVWRYEPDLEQVTIQAFEADVDRTPVMLLNAGAAEIAKSYSVTAISVPDSDRASFVLLPRNPDNLFERMTLSFRGPVLEEMQFEDSLGQKTSLSFSEVERNQEVDPTQFRFTPPAGVDIIDNTVP